jgi:hypothetical protein
MTGARLGNQLLSLGASLETRMKGVNPKRAKLVNLSPDLQGRK